MDDLGVLETLFRGIAIGAIAATGAGLWSGGGRSPARLAGVLFCVGVIAYAINSSPQLSDAIGWALPLAHFIALGGAGLFWLFIVALFDDQPVAPRTLAPWALLTALGLVGWAAPDTGGRGVWIVHNLIEAGFAAHALYVIVRSWRGDLVEARRRLRGPFLVAVTFYVLVLSTVEIAESLGMRATSGLRFTGGVSLAFFCTLGAVMFLQARSSIFGAAAPAPAADSLDAVDRATLARLQGLMGAGHAWRREGLTIGALAAEIGLPEHRLRRLINDRLGHRNFAAFLNAYRIEAAKQALADPAQARRPVSAIAFDLGYGSLGPFNRAFKQATGLTPSEWRKQAGSPNSEIPG
jgi:AraC-like DNA-binding protein